MNFFLQWYNLTLNDKGLEISRTQFYYLGSLSRCFQILYNVYIGEEHKAHLMQFNNKKDIWKIIFL
jgi:hypothetical protein